MSFWRRHRDTEEERSLTRSTIPPSMLPEPGTGQPMTPEAALRLADVFACVRVLADSAASLPLHAFHRAADGERERIDSRLAELLARPAPGSTTANLIGTVMAHLAVHGNAYIGKYRDARGTVTQLAPLPARSVTPRLEAGEPRYTLMRAEGVSEHSAADILHVRGLSIDGLTGMSPISQARQALGLAQSLAGHADTFARNAGRPGGVLRVSGLPYNEEDAQTLMREGKRMVEDVFSAEKAGQVAIIAAEQLEYKQLALSLVDFEFVEQRKLSTAEIARIFRVPPWMVGASSGDSMTYSNTESQALAFVKFTLSPWLAVIEQAISADKDLAPAGVFAEFVLDGLLRADSKTRADVYAQALDPDRGWMTRAEVRRLENLPPEPEEAPDA